MEQHVIDACLEAWLAVVPIPGIGSISVVQLLKLSSRHYKKWKGRNDFQLTVIESVVAVFFDDDDPPRNPRAAAAYVLYIRALADDVGSSAVRRPDDDFVRERLKMRPPLQQDEAERLEKRSFFIDYAELVADAQEPNPWFRVAVPHMEQDARVVDAMFQDSSEGWEVKFNQRPIDPQHETVTDIVCRGLSPRLQVGRVEDGVTALYDLTAWKRNGERECPAPHSHHPHWDSHPANLEFGRVPWRIERDVPYFAISYRRNQETNTITKADLREALRAIDAHVRESLLGSEYRVWLDLLVFEEGMKDRRWETYRLLPFLLLPTYQVKRARGVERAWLKLEDLCATAGPGKIHGGRGGIRGVLGMARQMAGRMPLLDAFSAVAEVVYSDVNLSGSMREEDIEHLQIWARSVLYGSDLKAVYGRFLKWKANIASLVNPLREKKRFDYLSLYTGPLADTKIAQMYFRTLDRSAMPSPTLLQDSLFSTFSQSRCPIDRWSATQLLYVTEDDLDANIPLLPDSSVDIMIHRYTEEVFLRVTTELREAVVVNAIYLKRYPTARHGKVRRIWYVNGKLSADMLDTFYWKKAESNFRMRDFSLTWIV